MGSGGEMKIGDVFPLAGYDIVASAQCDHGTVKVLNNNSSHYLVVECNENEKEGALVASFAYNNQLMARCAYQLALQVMALQVYRNTADGDPDPEPVLRWDPLNYTEEDLRKRRK
jgi:hypothetical protein